MALGFSFTLHASIITNFFKLPVPEFLIFAYKFNFGITLLFTTTIIFLSVKFKEQIGFLFLGGSAVKLMLFMAISYFKGFQIDRTVAIDFFVPYTICLLIEIFIISQIFEIDKNS